MKNRIRYLLNKKEVCGLDKAERWELQELLNKEELWKYQD